MPGKQAQAGDVWGRTSPTFLEMIRNVLDLRFEELVGVRRAHGPVDAAAHAGRFDRRPLEADAEVGCPRLHRRGELHGVAKAERACPRLIAVFRGGAEPDGEIETARGRVRRAG